MTPGARRRWWERAGRSAARAAGAAAAAAALASGATAEPADPGHGRDRLPVSTSTAHSTATATSTAKPEPGAVWVWPVTGRDVVRGFEGPEQRWSRGHRGIDIGGTAGEPVRAVQDGVVSHSGVIGGVGTITVRHGPDLRSTYQPVDARVSVGTRVGQGEQIGELAPGGHCTPQDCLHLGAILDRDTYVDPMGYLGHGEVSLMPPGEN